MSVRVPPARSRVPSDYRASSVVALLSAMFAKCKMSKPFRLLTLETHPRLCDLAFDPETLVARARLDRKI